MQNKPISKVIFACLVLVISPNLVSADEAAIKS